MFIIKAAKNIFFISLTLFFLAIFILIFYEDLLEFKYFIGYSLSSQYQKDRKLIEPYFDKSFYLNHYGNAVKKTGLEPIDHFLKKGWYSSNWKKHTDPNSWFNTILYQERLWRETKKNRDLFSYIFKIDSNPLVDFLNQPKNDKHHTTIEVWAKKDELTRAWLAIEGLLRLNKFNVVLHATNNLTPKDKIRFAPQIKRGLKFLPDNNQNKSFYHSYFIRNPEKYNLPNLKLKQGYPTTYVKQNFSYLMHRLYFINWKKVGRINPTMINIAHYCDEPLAYAAFYGNYSQRLAFILKNILHGGRDNFNIICIQTFKEYLIRIAEGFDLCLLNTKLPLRNSKIVPGCMSTWVNEQELNKNKEFSVSFLLTKKDKKGSEWNYKTREEVWAREKEFKIPTRFYVSLRDKDKIPKNLQNRLLPTYSKKWIFNSAFNIAIENTRQEYYFTEKLLDCFIALTVPIYLGCPNIYNYFDPRGIIVVQTVDELIKVTNSLTPEIYYSMLPYLKENKKRAMKLVALEKNIIFEFGKKLH